jgi:uncharacterized protein YdcH (DUF465 family)
MPDRKRAVIRRFPDREARIHELYEASGNFNALCRDYGETTEGLRRLEASVEAQASAEVERLRRRRADLDDQLLAMMQQTARV